MCYSLLLAEPTIVVFAVLIVGFLSVSSYLQVKQLTNDIPFILESLRGSTVVEIQVLKMPKFVWFGNVLLVNNCIIACLPSTGK